VTLPEDWQAGADLTRRVLSGETEMFHLEKRYRRKDGTVVWGLVSSTLIRDAQNKPLHFVTQILDITERKRAEEALRESESRYRELFESSSDAVFLVDTETCQIMEANHMATVLYGYDRDELLTKTSTELSAEPEDTRRRIQERGKSQAGSSESRCVFIARKTEPFFPSISPRGALSGKDKCSCSCAPATSPRASAPRRRCGRVRRGTEPSSKRPWTACG